MQFGYKVGGSYIEESSRSEGKKEWCEPCFPTEEEADYPASDSSKLRAKVEQKRFLLFKTSVDKCSEIPEFLRYLVANYEYSCHHPERNAYQEACCYYEAVYKIMHPVSDKYHVGERVHFAGIIVAVMPVKEPLYQEDGFPGKYL